MAPRHELLEQLKHAGKQLAFASRQFEREKMHIAVQKCAHVFGRCGNIILLQYTRDDARIGHPCDFDAAQVIGNSEALAERGYEGLHAGAARMNQSAIDIEKEQALAHFEFSVADCRLRFVLRQARRHAKSPKSEI